MTLSGNSWATAENSAVTKAEVPSASRPRHKKHITINTVPSGDLSSVLKLQYKSCKGSLLVLPDLGRRFVLFCVFVFVRAIVSWCS